METKETPSRTNTQRRLIQDNEYFKYIFKKTEKIACAVFYIVRSNKDTPRDDRAVSEVEDAAQGLIDCALESLKTPVESAAHSVREVAHALIRLESKLRIAHSARLVNLELLGVFAHEIDSVQRALRKYFDADIGNPMLEGGAAVQTPLRGERKLRARTETYPTQGGETTGRRERILGVVRDRGEASIKDIVAVVTDCSEKTIQRELNVLIKDGIVHREGERRWSKYKLVQ